MVKLAIFFMDIFFFTHLLWLYAHKKINTCEYVVDNNIEYIAH